MKSRTSYQFLHITFWMVFFGIIQFSCKIKPENQQKGTEIPLWEMKKNEAVFEVTGYPLPTSFYITSLLQEANAPYLNSLSNSVDNVEQYFSQPKKALNLGVYGTDLCYAVTYMENQQILLYLNVSKRLLTELNAMTVFHKNCCERVEDNLKDEDSLITIISDSFFDTYNYLNKNQRDETAILVITGSWVESLYIATQIAKTSTHNEKFLEIIAEQKGSLAKLLEIMELVKEDAEVQEIYTNLSEIMRVYGDAGGNISNEQFEKITKSVHSLRNIIIRK